MREEQTYKGVVVKVGFKPGTRTKVWHIEMEEPSHIYHHKKFMAVDSPNNEKLTRNMVVRFSLGTFMSGSNSALKAYGIRPAIDPAPKAAVPSTT